MSEADERFAASMDAWAVEDGIVVFEVREGDGRGVLIRTRPPEEGEAPRFLPLRRKAGG